MARGGRFVVLLVLPMVIWGCHSTGTAGSSSGSTASGPPSGGTPLNNVEIIGDVYTIDSGTPPDVRAGIYDRRESNGNDWNHVSDYVKVTEPNLATRHTQAAAKAKSVKLDELSKALHSMTAQTVIGPLTWDQKGDVTDAKFVFYVWKNGTYAEM